MRALGWSPTLRDIKKLYKLFEERPVPVTVGKEEFIGIMANATPASPQKVRMAFEVFDRTGTGWIDAEDLKRKLCTRGEPLSPDEADDIISQVPVNENGQINYADFVDPMLEPVERAPAMLEN